MISTRKSNDRGHVNFGWLDTYHSFSFGNYYDPDYLGFSKLRVINEDRLKGGRGFDAHPHKDMEIITYVMEGALEHKDSMGNKSVINKGDLQKMTAGKGVLHSEYNASKTETAHFLQIWIIPSELSLEPSYEQIQLDKDFSRGMLQLIATGDEDKNNGLIFIKQDADIYLASLEHGQTVKHNFDITRNIWIQVTEGSVTAFGQALEEGDGAGITDENQIEIAADKSAEFLLFDMN